jgi:hypothetical protein
LFVPKTIVHGFRQNDTPAEKWLAEVCAHAGCKVLHVVTPAQFKDLNDWTRAGATVSGIMGAIQEAKLIGAAAPKIQPTERRQHTDSEFAALVARWPNSLEAAALHGVAGELVKRLDPHTEADPAAILFQFLNFPAC